MTFKPSRSVAGSTQAGSAMFAAVGRCNVSRMRTATMKPDAKVSAATSHIAAGNPNASAVMPASNAPTAYPRSRQSRYTPIDDARHAGCATSPIAASSVG